MVGIQVSAHTIMQEIFDALPEPLLVLGAQREALCANAAFFRFFPVAQGQAPGSLAYPVEHFWSTIRDVNLTLEELRCQWAFEEKGTYAVRLGLLPLAHGETLVRVLAGSSSAETSSVFHAQRLETLGLLASGVAHDFNNVLTGILGHLAFLKSTLPRTGPHIDSLRSIEEGARKAAGLSQQILNFSKLDTTEESSEVDLGDLVARMVGLLRGSISPLCRLEYQTPTERLMLIGSEGRLAQVIVNLAVNASDAVAENGEIKIELVSCEDRGRLERIFSSTELPCASYIVLRVEDNGHGMPREVMERMFEPYFSTKRGKGTGLGLSTVAAIVRELGGCIEVQSEVNNGTVIEVYLPRIQSSVPAQDEGGAAVVPAVPRGTERILIVDDEFSVRNVLMLSLQHLGYDVQVAASGPEALELYRANERGFDLVILDMLMPQLPGEKVFARLKELDAAVRVLLISGFASQEAVRSVLSSGGLGFIQKPFTIEDLAVRVRKCFAQ